MLVISVLKRLNVHFIPLSSIITKYRSGTLVMFGSVNNWLKEHRGYLQFPPSLSVGGTSVVTGFASCLCQKLRCLLQWRIINASDLFRILCISVFAVAF